MVHFAVTNQMPRQRGYLDIRLLAFMKPDSSVVHLIPKLTLVLNACMLGKLR